MSSDEVKATSQRSYGRLQKIASSGASKSYANADKSVSSPKVTTLKENVLRCCELFKIFLQLVPELLYHTSYKLNFLVLGRILLIYSTEFNNKIAIMLLPILFSSALWNDPSWWMIDLKYLKPEQFLCHLIKCKLTDLFSDQFYSIFIFYLHSS